ncbi:hypothetical protein [Gimesia fumaroli]|uniref:Uncharacterized protein n=1 Tax=Gimesia fumaroli TaxID=2527976 RepID=A0A518IC74_9PLAN|nr:hypothetical protein [Gimesia fumaroli]QDV50696.1 hypothetical protein Enr17x_27380 [Gimesia fumaroli]
MFKFDERIKKYEARCKIVDGKGGVVSIDPGTRIYREPGRGQFFQHWLSDVQEDFDGELIPFEWVAEYVGVTRAALHKRVKKGNLTVLVYEMRERVKGVLGGSRERMRREYKFVPKTECDGWYSDLCEREDQSNKE